MTFKDWTITWLKAARAPFLVVSFIPAILGGAIAYSHGAFNWLTFILVTAGIVLAHSAADFIDDYFDFKNGNLGNKEQQFHDSPLIRGEITPRQVIIATLICLIPALAIGAYLLVTVGAPVLYMMALGTFIVYFYTAPPFKLNYRGVGESALFLAFGPMIVFGVYFVLTGQFSWEPILVSLPIGIFTMNVGLVSNTFDYEDDVQSGKRTLPVRFGQRAAVRVLNAISWLAFLVIAGAAALQIIPVWTLAMVPLALLARKVVNTTRLFHDVQHYEKAMSYAIGLSALAGIVLTLAYVPMWG